MSGAMASTSNRGAGTDRWTETYRRWLSREILLAVVRREASTFLDAVTNREAVVDGCVTLADELIRQTTTELTVWYRRSGADRWVAVGTAGNPADAVRLIGADGRRNGDWVSLPTGQDPNLFRPIR